MIRKLVQETLEKQVNAESSAFFCTEDGWSTADGSGRCRTSEIPRNIELPVPGSDVETACYTLRETQAATGMSDDIGMSDVADCFHRLLMEDALSGFLHFGPRFDGFELRIDGACL